jgi:hypothetical protein
MGAGAQVVLSQPILIIVSMQSAGKYDDHTSIFIVERRISESGAVASD